MLYDIWKGFVLQRLNHTDVAAIPQSPGIGALRWDERIFCCGFHHTCPSFLRTVCTDTAPASPKTWNPDTTTSCAPLMPPLQTTQASPFPLSHVCNSERFPAAKVNSEQVYLYRAEQDPVSNA